jgi:uracil DNA glycosylase
MSSPKYDGPRTVLYPKITRLKEGEIDVPDKELIKTKDGWLEFESINVIDSIHPSWHPLLLDRGISINERLKSIYKKGYESSLNIRPLAKDALNVFGTPIGRIKAVIVGQDPYPNWDKETNQPIACGYAFATISPKTPASLERIRLSIVKQFGSISVSNKEYPNALHGWIEQGVFLLNNTPILFTTFDDTPEEELSPRMKHVFKTPFNVWNGITEAICKEIIAANPICPFILMGKQAQYLERVVARSYVTSHPSTRTDCDFSGECFKGVPEINWKHM